MNVKDQQEKVKHVLAMCEMHWLVNRIPEDKVLEMSTELEQHLLEAVRDGKSVEAVVGPDEFAFAESWAEEDRPSWSLWDRGVEFGYVLCVMTATVTTIYHALLWAPVVPVRWFEVTLVLTNSVFLSRSLINPTSQTGPRWKRWSVVVVTALALVALTQGLSIFTLGSGNAVLIEWPWYATLVAVVAAIFLSRFRQGSHVWKERA